MGILTWIWEEWAETAFIQTGQALIKAGGQIMNLSIAVWKAIAKLAEIYLKQNVFEISYTQGPSRAGAEAATLAGHFINGFLNMATVAGCALAFMYFFIGFTKEATDLRSVLNPTSLSKLFLRLAVTMFLVTSAAGIARDVLKISTILVGSVTYDIDEMTSPKNLAKASGAYSIKKIKAMDVNIKSDEYLDWVKKEYALSFGQGVNVDTYAEKTSTKKAYASYINNKADSDAEEYGYFVIIYNQLTNGQTAGQLAGDVKEDTGYVDTATGVKATEWVLTGIVCVIGGLIGAACIIVSSYEILSAIISRLFRLLMCLPFGPVSFASLAAGSGRGEHAMSWVRTFITCCAEALLISLAIKVSIGMFGRIQLKPMDTSPMMAAMTDIVNLCIPLTAAAGCIKGSEHIVQKLLA